VRVDDILHGRTVFRGRVLIPKEIFAADDVNKEYTCESELAYLHDSIQSYKEVHDTTPKELLRQLLEVHNRQVEDYKKIYLGEVEVTNTTDNVYRFIDESADTYATIKDKLLNRDTLGGEMRLRYKDGKNYLDWKPEISKKTDTTIRIEQNLLEMMKEVDPTDVCTVLFPRGSRPEQTNTENTEEKKEVSPPRLTIESVNNGKEYLMAGQQLIDMFGIQGKSEIWEDVKDAQTLKNKGQKWLDSQIMALAKYDLKAVDLSLLGFDMETFWIGYYYYVYNPILNADGELRVSDMNININDPSGSTITIGNNKLTLSQYQVELKKAKKQVIELQSSVLEQQQKVRVLKKNVSDLNDNIVSLEGNVTTLEKENSSNKDGITTLKDYTNELERRLKELEGNKPIEPGKPIGKIIDVSEFQDDINWQQVKNDGLELAIIRVQDGSNYQDKKYQYNIKQCQNLNINYAVYAFARYVSKADAGIEAQDFYNRTQSVAGTGKQPAFYMIDVETVENNDMRGTTEAWGAKMESLGIPQEKQVAYIAHHLYPQLNLNVSKFGSIMIPAYRTDPPNYPYDLWQYTSTGSISGITGNVDMSKNASERFKKQYLGR